MSSSPLPSPAPQACSPASIALVTLVSILALIIGSVTGAALPRDPTEDFRVLVFSGRTAAASDPAPAGVAAVRKLGAENGFGVEVTDDPTVLDDTDLARFGTVVFINTPAARNGTFGAGERAALRRYIRAGGGWVGLHGASAGTDDWDWYEGLVGAELDRGTAPQTGRIKVLDHAHPSTVTLPDLWERTEEWPSWRADPGPAVHTLARIRVRDGISGVDQGVDHPWSWCQNYDGGRSWFTAGGSVASAFEDEAFLAHVLGGIEWAAGAEEGDCTATRSGAFQRTALTGTRLSDPVDIEVAPDRRVFVAERTGELRVVDQRTPRVSTVLDLAYAPDTVARLDGLIALALDPAFEDNGRLYLLRSDVSGGRLHLSRFTMRGNSVDPASEKRLLSLPGRRPTTGGTSPPSGSLAFDAAGHLYAATGDRTLPSASAASEDLRGAILRITPQDDGTYTVPEGNLFAPGTAGTAPEIYATGMRNPYRLTVDPSSGAVLIADDGAGGAVGYSRITEAGQVGRPHCAGGDPGDPVCAPRVAGPPDALGERAAGAMSGPVYAYDPHSLYRTRFPAYFSGKWLTYDGITRRFQTLSFQRSAHVFSGGLPPAAAGDLQSVNGVLDGMEWNRPSAAVFGPDGALYVIDSGLGGGTDGEGGSEGAGVFRIDYVREDRLPGAAVTSDRNAGPAPLTVAFTGTSTGTGTTSGADGGTGTGTSTGTGRDASTGRDVGGAGSDPGSRASAHARVTYAWDFDGDGTTDSTEVNPSHTFRTAGLFTARLTVTGPGGTATAGREITVGNTRAQVTVERPRDGGLFRFGGTLGFTVRVVDREDGGGAGGRAGVDCSRILVRSALGRPTRPVARAGSPGCHGSIVTEQRADAGTGVYPVTVEYTDEGARGAPELTGSASFTVRTAFQEAERYTSTGGVHGGAVAGSRAGASDGTALTEIEDGDWIAFAPVRLAGLRTVTVGAAPCGLGGTIEFRSGSPGGPLLGSLAVPGAAKGEAGASGVVSRTASLHGPAHGVRLYLVFVNSRWRSERPDLFTVDWLRFDGPRTG